MVHRLLLILALALPWTGCGAAYYASEGIVYEPTPEVARAALPGAAPVAGIEGKKRIAGKTGGLPEFVRKVIYTGRFTVDVYDMLASQKALQEFVESKGGHLQQLAGNTMILRVPSAQFKEVEPYLRKLGRIDDRLTDIRAQDITEQYVDLELRLKAKRIYLASLNTLLAEAGTLKDKLAVQQEIARVVEEIERLEGKLRLLSSQVAMATVTVSWRLAHSGSKRTFKLPWSWLDALGVENLTR